MIKEANKKKLSIGVVSQKDADVEVPVGDDLNKVGTVARIMKMLRMPDGTNTVILRGERRFQWDTIIEDDPYLKASVRAFGGIEEVPDTESTQALIESLKELAIEIITMSPAFQQMPPEQLRTSSAWGSW